MPPPKRNESPPKRKESIAMADCVFPEDIMLCILTRLPVKSILRFKSVCKPWCELFSTREFMKMHNGQFSSDPKSQSFIIQNRTGGFSVPMGMDYGGPMSLLNIESNEKKPSILHQPCLETHLMNIVGCCNGLLCMGRPRLGQGSIVLWNPAMKLFKFVRVLKNVDFRGPKMVSLGFGYDAEGDDFKVVRIVCLKGENKSIGVEVYSVNSDSWVTIKPGFQFSVSETENLVIVNGNPYWFANIDENESDVLVWFDVRKMVFKVVPMSSLKLIYGEMAGVVVLDLLVDWKGSLGVLVCTNDPNEMDVWVFDDGEQIWRKNHTFGPIEVKEDGFLQCSNNGKIVGESPDGKLFVFDPENGCVKVYDTQIPPFKSLPCLYTESLTYIKGMRPVQVNTGRGRLSMAGPRPANIEHVCEIVGSYPLPIFEKGLFDYTGWSIKAGKTYFSCSECDRGCLAYSNHITNDIDIEQLFSSIFCFYENRAHSCFSLLDELALIRIDPLFSLKFLY